MSWLPFLTVAHAAPAPPDPCAEVVARVFAGQTGASLLDRLDAELGLFGLRDRCEARAWGPHSFVLLVERGRRVALGRFDEVAGQPKLVAKSRHALQNVDSIDGMYVDGQVRLDLADYRVAPGARALGLRVGVSSSCNGWNAACEDGEGLVLLDAASLAPLLAVQMASESFTAHCDPTSEATCTGRSRTTERILVVSDHQTLGHFDLEVRPRDAQPGSRWDRPTVFQWTGSRYEESQP